MVFSDGVFLFLFLPIALVVYYSPFCKSITVKNIWLFFISLIFYAWGEPLYIILMLLSICVNWLLGRWVSGYSKSAKGKKIVFISCIYNLGVLFVFKYASWLLVSFRIVPESNPIASLTLPIGISFYTFQALSYVIDIYRGEEQAQKSILNVGLYIAFFPQLVAGPIVRYGPISKQLKERKHSFDLFSAGVWRFIIGLSKKILLSNQLAVVADLAFGKNAGERSVVFAWFGALAFMLQIYFDFSGYSDMAIGLGKMFGFEFFENFNYPYISRSITEYWKRWHISLGEWFRDYLYYPLSFGPAIKIRKVVAKKWGRKVAGIISSAFTLFVVRMATGIWHGANWTFVVWGLIQFILIFWEQYRKPLKNKKLGNVIGFITTFLIVMCTKVIFKSDSMTYAVNYYASMLHLNGNVWIDEYGMYWINQYKIIMIIGFVLVFPVLEQIGKWMKTARAKMIWSIGQAVAMCLFLVLDICYAISGGYNPFIYFNF